MASRTKMFTGFRNKFWKTKTLMEVLRFSMYITVPVFSSCIYANPERMHKIITYLKLVEYPEAVTDIPLGDDIFKIRDENNALVEKFRQMTADEKEKGKK